MNGDTSKSSHILGMLSGLKEFAQVKHEGQYSDVIRTACLR